MAKSWDINAVQFANKNIERAGVHNIRRERIPKIHNSIWIKIQQPIVSANRFNQFKFMTSGEGGGSKGKKIGRVKAT